MIITITIINVNVIISLLASILPLPPYSPSPTTQPAASLFHTSLFDSYCPDSANTSHHRIQNPFLLLHHSHDKLNVYCAKNHNDIIRQPPYPSPPEQAGRMGSRGGSWYRARGGGSPGQEIYHLAPCTYYSKRVYC